MEEITGWIFLILAFGIFLFFVAFSISSTREYEKRAAFLSLCMAFILPGLLLIIASVSTLFIQLLVLAVLALLTILILVPTGFGNFTQNEIPQSQFDERNIVFSRNELKVNTPEYDAYYQLHPELKHKDDYFRQSPPLLGKNSTKYHKKYYEMADALFKKVEELVPLRQSTTNETQAKHSAQEFSEMIKAKALELGAVSVGITTLKPHHLYSYHGRGDRYGNPVANHHPFAIAITVEMDRYWNKTAPEAPTVAESAKQYLNSGRIATSLSKYIADLGYKALAHIDGNYDVICPPLARDAGLGEIGRMGLLISPELGPRLRIAVVTTDLPLVVDERQPDQSVHYFCKYCKKCASNCPVNAIDSDTPKKVDGAERYSFEQLKCYTFWRKTGNDCGRCMSVCPYSHPNNFFHQNIRNLISRNRYFSRMALLLDDVFYGSRPKSLSLKQFEKIQNEE